MVIYDGNILRGTLDEVALLRRLIQAAEARSLSVAQLEVLQTACAAGTLTGGQRTQLTEIVGDAIFLSITFSVK